jgi:hypothetical protein
MSADTQMIIVEVQKDDAEFMAAVSETFGDTAQPISARNFDGGLVDAVQIALPIVAATAPFLIKYFTVKKPRVVIDPRGKVTLEGYGAKEVAGLLEKIKSRRTPSSRR